jgi:hypothetical protein
MQGFDFEQNSQEFIGAIRSLLQDPSRDKWTLNDWKEILKQKLSRWPRTLTWLLECFNISFLVKSLEFLETHAKDLLVCHSFFP